MASLLINNPQTEPSVFNTSFLIDDSGKKEIRDVLILESESWTERQANELNFGYTRKPVWIRLSSDVFSSKQNIVDLNFPQLDYVDLYIVDLVKFQVVEHLMSGDRRLFSSKSIQSEKVMFLVNRPDEVFQVYVRIQTDGSNQAPISILSLEDHLKKIDLVGGLLHFFLGFSLFTVIMSGISLFVYRDMAYLYYIILSLSISTVLLFHYRTINAYTSAFSIDVQHFAIVLAMIVSFYGGIKFVDINFRKWGYRKFDSPLKWASSFSVFIVLACIFIDYQVALIIVFTYLGLIAPFILYMLLSFSFSDQNNKYIRSGWSLSVAWLIFLFGAGVQILGEAGVIYHTNFVNHGFLFGSLGIVLSMGLILSSNLQLESEQKLQAEKELALTNQRLYQSDKLAVISTMSSGLIHEIKNPLNWTKASMTIALDEVDDKSELKELVEDSLEGLNQIENIVQGLNWYAKSKVFALTPHVNLRDIIERTLNLAKSQCDGLVILNDVSPELEVYGSENHLAQVIINIFTNSIKAIKKVKGPHVGKIQITAGEVQSSARNGKRQIFLSWLDNGVGVDKDKIDKLFDPFFTTDELQEGVGLGMSIAKQIIEKHEGKMEIISEKNEWTRINFYLNQS